MDDLKSSRVHVESCVESLWFSGASTHGGFWPASGENQVSKQDATIDSQFSQRDDIKGDRSQDWGLQNDNPLFQVVHLHLDATEWQRSCLRRIAATFFYTTH